MRKNGRLARVLSAGWNMASNRIYGPLIPLASLCVGSTRLHSASLGSFRLRSTCPDQARIPTGNDVGPFEFRIQEPQKNSRKSSIVTLV